MAGLQKTIQLPMPIYSADEEVLDVGKKVYHVTKSCDENMPYMVSTATIAAMDLKNRSLIVRKKHGTEVKIKICHEYSKKLCKVEGPDDDLLFVHKSNAAKQAILLSVGIGERLLEEEGECEAAYHHDLEERIRELKQQNSYELKQWDKAKKARARFNKAIEVLKR